MSDNVHRNPCWFMDFRAFILIYIVFRMKQFVCDFLLQTDWMAMNKGKPGIEGYKALFTHTAIHAAATLLIMLVFMPALWWLALVDFVIHSAVDRAKGLLTYKMKWGYTGQVVLVVVWPRSGSAQLHAHGLCRADGDARGRRAYGLKTPSAPDISY